MERANITVNCETCERPIWVEAGATIPRVKGFVKCLMCQEIPGWMCIREGCFTQIIPSQESSRPHLYCEDHVPDDLLHYAHSGVLPLTVSQNGAPYEPLTEVIICASINRSSEREDGMPLRLILHRRLDTGKIYSCVYYQSEPVEIRSTPGTDQEE